MRQILPLLILLFVAQQSIAQNFERSYNLGFELIHGTAIAPVEDGSILVGATAGDSFGTQAVVIKLDSNGDVIYFIKLPSNCNYSNVIDILPDETGYLIMTTEGCCDTPLTCKLFHIDRQGGNLFEVSNISDYVDGFPQETTLCLLSDQMRHPEPSNRRVGLKHLYTTVVNIQDGKTYKAGTSFDKEVSTYGIDLELFGLPLEPGSSGSLWVKVSDRGSFRNVSHLDLQLKSIRYGRATKEIVDAPFSGTGHVTLHDVEIELSNMGTEPISSFTINGSTDALSICARRTHTMLDFEGQAELVPGGSLTILYLSITFMYHNGEGEIADFDFWTSVPNGKVDRNIDNNTYSFSAVLASEQPSTTNAHTANIMLYPNPAINNITLKLPSIDVSDYQISMLDSYGNTIENINPASANVDIAHLETGVYFVRVCDKLGECIVHRFLKM